MSLSTVDRRKIVALLTTLAPASVLAQSVRGYGHLNSLLGRSAAQSGVEEWDGGVKATDPATERRMLADDMVAAQRSGGDSDETYPQNKVELAAGILPTNTAYPPLTVERYGADPTGAHDCGPAFRSACRVAAFGGGGKINAIGKIYAFYTWDTTSFQSTNNLALFCLPRNTELAGGGMFVTRLRISSQARIGMYSHGMNRTHIIGMRAGATGQYVHDLQFDFDGIVQTSPQEACYFVRTMSGGCLIERCYGANAPIRNAIVDSSGTHGSAIVVRGCCFHDCGPNMQGNESLSLDLSYLYLQAPNSTAEGNTIFNSANANHNCGGIEMHSPRYIARDNFLMNLWPAMYLGVEDKKTISSGSQVRNNYLGYNATAIHLIDHHNGLSIADNFFEANSDDVGFGPAFTDVCTPINSDTGRISSGLQTGLSITGNYFDCRLMRTGAPRDENSPSISINVGAIDGGCICDNLFLAPQMAVILQGNVSATNSDICIENNNLLDVADCRGAYTTGFFGLLADARPSWGGGATFRDVFIRYNKIFRDRRLPATNTRGLVITGSVFAPEFTNIRFEDNDLINVPYEPTGGTYVSSVIMGTQITPNDRDVAVDPSRGSHLVVRVSNLKSFRILSPERDNHIVDPGAARSLIITIVNQSGTAIGDIDWGSAYRMAKWESPDPGYQRSITFAWDAGSKVWHETARTPYDVPN